MGADLLVYIRETDVPKVLQQVSQDTIPEHIKIKFEEERLEEERIKKERKEARFYVTVNLIDLDALKNYQQFPNFDLIDFSDEKLLAKLNKVRVLKKMTLADLSIHTAEKLNLSPSQIRLWSFVERQNGSTRIYKPLPLSDKRTISFYFHLLSPLYPPFTP